MLDASMQQAHEATVSTPMTATQNPAQVSKVRGTQEFGNRIQAGQDVAAQGEITSAGIGTGAFKGAAETAHTAGRLINKVTGDNISGLPTSFAEPESTRAANPSESIGKVGENVLEFLTGDEALKSLSLGARLSKLSKIASILEEHPLLAKAVAIGGNAIRTGTVGGTQAAVHGADTETALESGAIAGGTGATLESLGAGLGALKRYLWPGNVLRYLGEDGTVTEVAATKHGEIPPGAKLIPPGSTQTAEATATKGLPAQKAGEEVQQQARTVRDLKGAELGRAKSAVESSIPTTSSGEKVAMTFSPSNKSAVTANSVLSDLGNSKVPLNDPAMSDVQDLAKQFSTGTDANGKPLTMSLEQIDATNRALSNKINALQTQVKNGANGTALGYLKQLKSAFQDDVYAFYEKVGDPEAAQNVQKLSKEYAGIVKDQTKGPASTFLKSKSPEKIVTSIISNGANSQSAVEGLVKNLTPEGVSTLQDSVTKQLYAESTLPSGEINMQRVQERLVRMGQAAKSLYGDRYADLKSFVDAAAELQKTKNATSMTKTIIQKGTKMLGTAAGAHVAGPIGAIGGEEAGQAVTNMVIGKSGAVKIGISPTETITLAPKQVNQPGVIKLLTNFANVAKAGKAKEAAAALSAIQARISDEDTDGGPTHYYDPKTKTITPVQ